MKKPPLCPSPVVAEPFSPKRSAWRSSLAGWLLLCSFPLAAVVPSSAAVIASYDAGATEVAQSPVSQGWAESGNLAVTPVAGVETIGGKSYNYWNISNASPGSSGFSAVYRKNLVATDFSNPAGWTATLQLRVEQAPNTYNSTWVQISDGQSSWEIGIVNNTADGHTVNYRNASGALSLLSSYDVGANYFTLQMYFDPGASNVSFFLNGTQIGSAVSRISVGNATAGQYYVRFGDNDGSPRPYRTISHWNTVQFETGYAVVVPEGNTALLLLGGGGLLLLTGCFGPLRKPFLPVRKNRSPKSL